MKTYAGIGTRHPTEFQKWACHELAAYMTLYGWSLRTGAAIGCDQAFAEGAAVYNGGQVTLSLPWPGYEAGWVEDYRTRMVENRDDDLAVTLNLESYGSRPRHFVDDMVSKCYREPLPKHSAKWNLMCRNVMVLFPNDQPCDLVIAARAEADEKSGVGGTEFGVALAKRFNIPLLEVPREADSSSFPEDDIEALKGALRSMGVK